MSPASACGRPLLLYFAAAGARHPRPDNLRARIERQRRPRGAKGNCRRPLTDSPNLQPLPDDVAGSTIRRMNTATKLLVAMRRNPLDWQIAQLQTVARQMGIDWRHDGSSHCVFVRSDGKTLPVPAHRPIKPIYVKKFIELVDGA